MANLSSFYLDNSYKPEDFEVFSNIEEDTVNYFVEYTEGIMRNKILTYVETYRILAACNLPLYAAYYDLEVVLTNEEVSSYLGFGGMSIKERVDEWNLSMPANDLRKFKALDFVSAYLELSAITSLGAADDGFTMNYDVSYMDIFKGDEKYQIGVDFDIRSNRLYLLSEKMLSVMTSEDVYRGRNVAVDFDTVNRYFGSNFNLPKYSDLSKDIYNEMIQKMTQSALGGPTVKKMREGLAVITGSDTGNVFDYLSSPEDSKDLWKNYDLTPFDFVIEIPALFSTSDTLSDIIKRYFNTVKMADSDYMVVLNSGYEEVYARHVVAKVDDEEDILSGTYDESYNYRAVVPQTNNPDYYLNNNFTTEITRGVVRYEQIESVLINTETGEEEFFNY